MKAVQHLVEFLAALDTQYIFGIPGGTIAPLTDAIQDEPRLKLIVSRHETGAAYAAAAFAKQTGKLGVVTSCSGPGATNLLTGVAAAMREQVPLLVLTGQVPVNRMGLLAAQEASPWTMDICQAFRPFTKKSVLVTRPELLAQALNFASRIAFQHPQGPVHLAIPVDVQEALIGSDSPAPMGPLLPFLSGLSVDTTNKVRQFVGRGGGVLYLGAGTRQISKTDVLVEFAERLQWPVVTSPAAKGVFPEVHSLSAGVFGLAGNDRAKFALKRCHRILVLGSGLGELATANWSVEFFADKELAQVDACPDHLGRYKVPSLPIVSSIESFVAQMITQLESPTATISLDLPPFEQSLAVIPRHLENFANRLPSDAFVYSDIGEHMTWAIRYWRVLAANSFDISIDYGGMGSGISSAIGHALAEPQRVTACITGDGCVAMHGGEFLAAAYYKLPIVYLVLNNSGYGMVKWGQQLIYGRAAAELGDHRFDIAKFAEAAGCHSIKICDLSDWNSVSLPTLLEQRKPIIIEVKLGDSAETPPMADRVNLLRGNHC